MTNIEIKNLLQTKRFPENELKRFCLLLYLPFGLFLFILRTILAISVVLIGCSLTDAPIIHNVINKIACLFLGITVKVENPEKREDVEVYISNHLSIFDHLAVHTVTGSVSPGSELHPALARGFGLHYFGTTANMENFKKKISKVITEQKIPIHFTPEDKITNGRALLKFKNYPFSFSSKVQPVCISIERPLLDISVTKIGASYWIDFLYYMFSPLTNYKLKFLPVLERGSMDEGQFAEIVRQNIATSLKVEVPDFTASDVIEWEKRKLIEEQQRSPQLTSRQATPDGELRNMAVMVKEVLPHVPLNTIYRELNKTRSVDATITNILEGRVRFVPERPISDANPSRPSTSSHQETINKSSPSSSSTNKDIFNTAAATFAKNAVERSLSFQERKEKLIASARKRYIIKHNLDIPV